MIVKHEGKNVDVVDRICPKRSCFHLGQDKGTFAQGRGYTSYHKTPRWVCWTRHLHGCPHPGQCQKCGTAFLELQTKCRSCGEQLP